MARNESPGSEFFFDGFRWVQTPTNPPVVARSRWFIKPDSKWASFSSSFLSNFLRKRPKSAGLSHEWSWLSLLRPRGASVEFAWGQRRCVRDPAFTSPKERCSQRASRSGTVLSTRTVDGCCGRPRRSNCSCGPLGGRAPLCFRAARRRCFDEHGDPAADGALRADGTRDFKK